VTLVAHCVGHRNAAIWSLWGDKRTLPGHRKSGAPDPERHFATIICRIAKGLFASIDTSHRGP
jgi:hypothetical protein